MSLIPNGGETFKVGVSLALNEIRRFKEEVTEDLPSLRWMVTVRAEFWLESCVTWRESGGVWRWCHWGFEMSCLVPVGADELSAFSASFRSFFRRRVCHELFFKRWPKHQFNWVIVRMFWKLLKRWKFNFCQSFKQTKISTWHHFHPPPTILSVILRVFVDKFSFSCVREAQWMERNEDRFLLRLVWASRAHFLFVVRIGRLIDFGLVERSNPISFLLSKGHSKFIFF